MLPAQVWRPCHRLCGFKHDEGVAMAGIRQIAAHL